MQPKRQGKRVMIPIGIRSYNIYIYFVDSEEIGSFCSVGRSQSYVQLSYHKVN